MNKILLSFLIIVNISCWDGATYIHGYTYDIDNNPIQDAKIEFKIDSLKETEYSDENGYFSIGSTHGCSITGYCHDAQLTVSKENYKTITKKFSCNETHDYTFVLELE